MEKTRKKRCPACGQRERRTIEQNKRYWAMLNEMAKHDVEGVFYDAKTWHAYMKQEYIGCEDVILPSGKPVTIVLSTAEMDVPEFNEFMDHVETFMGEHGWFLPE